MVFPLLASSCSCPPPGGFLLFLRDDGAVRWTALGITVLDFALCIAMLAGFDATDPRCSHREAPVGARPRDHLRARRRRDQRALRVLTARWAGSACSPPGLHRPQGEEFMVSLLVMQALMLGVFCALDLFLFYVFWEAMLIPCT